MESQLTNAGKLRRLQKRVSAQAAMNWMIPLTLSFSILGCARAVTVPDIPPPPVVFEQSPDLAALAAAVNRVDAIESLSTNSARVDVLSMSAVPKLSATMHLQRHKNFRLRASLPIVMGSGLDLGSNDQEFWFEVPEGMTQTLYHARHDVYANRLDRAILPVEPTWIMGAVGLARLDPNSVIAGPVTRTDGMLEVRTSVPTPAGIFQQVYFIEPQAGYITHQFLYSPQQQLVAKSYATNHAFYDSVNCVLPHQVKLELFPAAGPPLALQLDIERYSVNQLLSGDPQLFAKPTDTRNQVDLTQIAGGPLGSSSLTTTYAKPIQPAASAWAMPTTAASQASAYSANAPTGPPLRGMR